MKLFTRVLALFIFSGFLYAGGVGTTAANFLRIGTGAKAAGMGEAQVAISNNVDSIFWNPAGLALVKNTEIGLMHLMYWQGINYEYAAIALPVNKIGTFGVGIDYLNSGSIDKTTENITGSAYNIVGNFSYMAFAGTIAYGNKIIFERMPLNVGASLKIVGDKIDDDMVLGAGLDLGIIYPFQKNGYFGFVINNIGVIFTQRNNALPLLPMQLKAGGAYLLDFLGKSHGILVALDGTLPFDAGLKFNAGLEYSYEDTLFLRAGYKMGYALENLTAGAGFRLTLDRTQYELNYSYTPGLEDIGTSHRVSLIVRLGLPLAGDDKAVFKDDVPENTPAQRTSEPSSTGNTAPKYPMPMGGPTQRRR